MMDNFEGPSPELDEMLQEALDSLTEEEKTAEEPAPAPEEPAKYKVLYWKGSIKVFQCTKCAFDTRVEGLAKSHYYWKHEMNQFVDRNGNVMFQPKEQAETTRAPKAILYNSDGKLITEIKES